MTAMEREQPQTTARFAGPEQIRAGERSYAGVRTRVLEIGPRRLIRGAPRLVFLHGYCDSADTWRPVLEQLSETGISAVAVDLPGFGEADPLRPGPMLPQLDQFVDAVLEEQTKHGKVVLAGNSLGGTMALRAAHDSRRPIAGVISVAAPGFADSWLVRAVVAYPLRLWAALPLPVPDFVVRGVAEYVVPRLLYADHGVAAAEHVRRFTSLFPDYRSATTRLDQARQLVEELTKAYDGIGDIATPLLVVACGKDRLVTPDSGRRLHSLVPHSRLLIRENWGHCPQLDDPTAVAGLVGDFIADVTSKRRRPKAARLPMAG
ncbi:alpha/beta fold hydrolase [Amycolatopsis pithecellobii]|uniref:Alpha/beta fold hydrolase n=1 Tax=Amycolatopsis pithecellobii TaxID=664692 RepID=A0A6N7ZB20_9PSEU|nr:alpha/beta hydrolase [Amycolatopsis pithecellobii]MTD58875.1 alpha/beta fold hydrolase [Amycolatopsis pithecellobii]